MRLQTLAAGVLAALIGVVGCQRTTVEGPAGKKLTLIKPADQTIKQGATDQVTVRINRDNFRDAINIKFDQLPAGVELQDKDLKIASDQSSATFTLKANSDAPPIDKHQVTVTAEGPDNMKAMQQFYVTVKADKDASAKAPRDTQPAPDASKPTAPDASKTP